MDLIRHLRFFVAVADEGHFGRAATALDMTQPPLSQGIQRLEKHLGVELLHRTRQGAMLTSAGSRLLPRARLLVDDAQQLLAESQRLAQSRGAVHWGVTPALPGALVTAGVSALRASVDSGAAVSTTVGSTVELVGEVRAGVCDIAVIEHPALVDGVESGPVVKLPRWLVVPADHPVAAAERPTFPMLGGLTFAHSPRAANPPAFDSLTDLFRERGLDPHPVLAADDRTLFAAVAAGTSFAVTTTAPTATPGIAWLRLAPHALALRARVIRRPGAEPFAAAVDRVLYRERIR
ncbi:LysR family transcriptional regulator [Nocardia sp. 2]|uniref:LysR family transcriptional regulator n=1 Tax=Nocardia acididurans TaxID=2802282 RepID=A0ABS1M8A7_9NOCA|nr:LysR family transcriptional regulator [Nocardia acididurans]MBL1076796.1 LysR family transcriptional regulator [Nocardia acididurans]